MHVYCLFKSAFTTKFDYSKEESSWGTLIFGAAAFWRPLVWHVPTFWRHVRVPISRCFWIPWIYITTSRRWDRGVKRDFSGKPVNNMSQLGRHRMHEYIEHYLIRSGKCQFGYSWVAPSHLSQIRYHHVTSPRSHFSHSAQPGTFINQHYVQERVSEPCQCVGGILRCIVELYSTFKARNSAKNYACT